MLRTYLGRRGYCVYKEDLDASEQEAVRQELRFSPKTGGGSYGTPPSFPAYRESERKMYVPQHYGTNKFGPPCSTVHSGGLKTTMEFNGALRNDQQEVFDKYISHVGSGGCGLLELYCGFGKTVVALALAAHLGLKTLVVVHKDFLVTQWSERIRQFLPTAKIGKIQGPCVATDGCDIVIGMLQSLSTKSYPETLWDQFGLTIVDECHHMSAEVFSNALFKIVTPYMLGLSATMTRKDGLSKVFKLFLGKVVAKKKRARTDVVKVIRHNFSCQDDEYAHVELDYRGQVKYASMITKVHSFGPRSDFVCDIILGLVKEEEAGRQALILAQNRNLLTYMMEVLEREGVSAGFYVGGMREGALTESAKKRVILATYGMAEEALDIKGLSTLVLASPRTSVEQAVGRILRTNDNAPVVHDVVDQHPVFQRQWKKRSTFYTKNGYTIVQATSNSSFVEEDTSSGLAAGVCYV